ncbi:hypothetical protein EYF80_028141 [Liparis tanakae]|uniref:Uncharacterized protein n=1 Tax=Liparis tanakae TaxID=230148 RepID=A0A4Z2H7A0_9TELE|nr:hypothetical protein EYF80_028141 [Liparis tanakae]
MDEVFVGAADDVVVGDGDGVDAAPAGLQDVDTLQRADVPNLTDGGEGTESERDNGKLSRVRLLPMSPPTLMVWYEPLYRWFWEATSALTQWFRPVLLELIQLLRQFAQHGPQESNVLVLLGQSQLHLVESKQGQRTHPYLECGHLMCSHSLSPYLRVDSLMVNGQPSGSTSYAPGLPATVEVQAAAPPAALAVALQPYLQEKVERRDMLDSEWSDRIEMAESDLRGVIGGWEEEKLWREEVTT